MEWNKLIIVDTDEVKLFNYLTKKAQDRSLSQLEGYEVVETGHTVLLPLSQRSHPDPASSAQPEQENWQRNLQGLVTRCAETSVK